MGQAGGGCHTPPSFFSEFLKGDLRFDAETFSSYSLIPPGNFDASTVSLLHLTLPWQPRVDTRDRPFFFQFSNSIAELVPFYIHYHFESIFYKFTLFSDCL